MHWMVAGMGLAVAGFALARLASKLVETDDTDDRPQVRHYTYILDEQRLPPFIDKDLPCVQTEGEYDENGDRQLAIVGISQQELQRLHGTFAVARRDASGVWRPAQARGHTATYGLITEPQAEMAAVAFYVGAGEQCLALGGIKNGIFTAAKHTHLLALTNNDGLLYDYPEVPIADLVST